MGIISPWELSPKTLFRYKEYCKAILKPRFRYRDQFKVYLELWGSILLPLEIRQEFAHFNTFQATFV